MTLSSWNQFLRILETTVTYAGDKYTFQYSLHTTCRLEAYARALEALEERKNELIQEGATEAGSFDFSELSKLNFLMEQISLLDCVPHQRTFTLMTAAWTEAILKRSVEAYRFLESSGSLTLPHIRTENIVSLHDIERKKSAAERRQVSNNNYLINSESGDDGEGASIEPTEEEEAADALVEDEDD